MSQNKPIWVTGLMSGTSLDGVDAACVLTDGMDILEFGPSCYQPYTPEERDILRSALGKWPLDPGLDAATTLVKDVHYKALQQLPKADLIGFHGQTLAHEPQYGRTHQLGDGAGLARLVGVPVVWNFRLEDVACGGQGAPLAPIYHWAMVRYAKISAPVAVVNLGGIGNLTLVDPKQPPEMGILAFDTGPANAPLNDYMTFKMGLAYDDCGSLAAQGCPDFTILDQFLRDNYFVQAVPKSLDRGDFPYIAGLVADLSAQDAAATLTAIIVAGVVAALDHMPVLPQQMWITGGGRKNCELMRLLKVALPMTVHDIDYMGFDGDMVEAQAFAYLAARVARGFPTSFPRTTGVSQPLYGGTISPA
jgi:anhydro-N-acetylmuramic acid kinase